MKGMDERADFVFDAVAFASLSSFCAFLVTSAVFSVTLSLVSPIAGFVDTFSFSVGLAVPDFGVAFSTAVLSVGLLDLPDFVCSTSFPPFSTVRSSLSFTFFDFSIVLSLLLLSGLPSCLAVGLGTGLDTGDVAGVTEIERETEWLSLSVSERSEVRPRLLPSPPLPLLSLLPSPPLPLLSLLPSPRLPLLSLEPTLPLLRLRLKMLSLGLLELLPREFPMSLLLRE